MRRAIVAVAGAALAPAVLIAGCNLVLGIGDVPEPAATSTTSTTTDGGTDDALPPYDAAGCDACQNTSILPEGWIPIIYSIDAAADPECPSGFGYREVLAQDPQVADGGCTCSSQVAAPPSCTTGQGTVFWSEYADCDASTELFTFDGGDCRTLPGMTTIPQYVSVTWLPPSGGTCLSAAVTNAGALTTTPVATCVPTECEPDLCAQGLAPTGYAGCIGAAGDHDCPPAGGPFTVKRQVASTFDIVCSCTHSDLTADCINQAILLYNAVDCSSGSYIGVLALDVNPCLETQFSQTARSILYTADVQNVACASSIAESVDAAATELLTLCCAP